MGKNAKGTPFLDNRKLSFFPYLEYDYQRIGGQLPRIFEYKLDYLFTFWDILAIIKKKIEEEPQLQS